MPREGGGGGAGTSAAAFRSFGFCKDPVGVVELPTIRKPRASPTPHKTTDQKLESSKNRPRFLDGPCLDEKVLSNRDRPTVRDDDTNSSRRSWSCATNHNDVVAADFLKGAFDLEHSLALLRKLQDDSNYLSTREEQRKSTTSGGSRYGDLELGKMNLFNYPKPVGDEVRLHYAGSQGPCCSSKKDWDQHPFADIKRQMRDGASASLNDLFDSSPLTEDRRVVMDSSDVPSTSSSCHTSFVHSSGFVSPESSTSSTASPKKKNKKKKSNLVAKLVSLEDTFWRRSSSPLNPSRRRLKEQRKPPVDSIRATTQYSDSQVMDEKRKTLDEMIEAVKLKGLLKNSTSNKADTGNHSLNSGFFSSKQKWCGDETPPIVVIKPTMYSCLNLDLPISPMPRDKATPTSKEIVRSSRESPVLNKSLKQTKMVEGGGVIKDRVWKGEVYYDRRAVNKVLTSPATKTKLQKGEKEFDPVCLSRGKEDIWRNLYFNTNPGNDHRSKLGNQAHFSGSGYWWKNRSKNDHKSSEETRRHIADDYENRDKSRDHSSIDGNESILQLDTNTVLADQLDRDGNIIEDLAEKEYSIPRKIASQPSPRVNAKTNCIVGGGIEYHLQASIGDYEEFDCSISESSSLTSFEEDEYLEQEINKLISPISQIRLVSPHKGVETVHHTDDAQSHPDQSDTLSPDTSKEEEEAAGHENDRESRAVTTADRTYLDCALGEEEECGEIARWKVMLLRSSSFIHHANKLFDLQADPERCIANEESDHHHYQDEQLLVSSSTLVLDCANELLAFYGYLSQERLMRILHRRHGLNRGSYCFTSLYQVADQVCKGIDSLRSQRKDDGDCGAAGNLPLIVERDLMGSNGVISGVWGVGWNNSMGTIDDVEDIARLVNGVILEGLIKEIVEESFSV